MDHNEEKLNRCLDSYTVEDADPALLEGIILQARTLKQESKIVPLTRASWFKNASAVAAVAICGFWMGGASLETADEVLSVSQTNAINFDTVILGPKTIHEVML